MLKKSLFVALCAGLAVTVFAATPQSVEDALMQTTGLKADAVQKSPVPGMWEVVVQDRVFYVDDQARYVLYGSLIDTVKQTNLTNERLRERSRERWKEWPFQDAVKQVFGKGEREVVVFSDANCTYCRAMESVYAQVGNVTVYTFITPMLRGETNAREIVCAKDRAKAWHEWMGNNVRPNSVLAGCDTSMLQRNLVLANRLNVTGAPTFFFKSGDRVTGAMAASQFEARLDGGISLEVFDDKRRRFERLPFVFAACPSASAADHDVLGLHAVGYEHPGECVALLAASSLAGLVAESPEVVEADDAANGAARILCDDGAHDLQSGEA